MLLGTSPLSYVIPSFPPAVRFVRPEGNLSLRPGDRLYGQIASTITDADRIFLVYRDGDGAVNLPVTLAQWGLNSARPACAPLDTNIPDKLVVCGLNPASP